MPLVNGSIDTTSTTLWVEKYWCIGRRPIKTPIGSTDTLSYRKKQLVEWIVANSAGSTDPFPGPLTSHRLGLALRRYCGGPNNNMEGKKERKKYYAR